MHVRSSRSGLRVPCEPAELKGTGRPPWIEFFESEGRGGEEGVFVIVLCGQLVNVVG